MGTLAGGRDPDLLLLYDDSAGQNLTNFFRFLTRSLDAEREAMRAAFHRGVCGPKIVAWRPKLESGRRFSSVTKLAWSRRTFFFPDGKIGTGRIFAQRHPINRRHQSPRTGRKPAATCKLRRAGARTPARRPGLSTTEKPPGQSRISHAVSKLAPAAKIGRIGARTRTSRCGCVRVQTFWRGSRRRWLALKWIRWILDEFRNWMIVARIARCTQTRVTGPVLIIPKSGSN